MKELISKGNHSDMKVSVSLLLSHKVPKYLADDILNLFLFFRKKIGLGISCEHLLGRWFTWNVKTYFLRKIKKKVYEMSSAAVVMAALIEINYFHRENIRSCQGVRGRLKIPSQESLSGITRLAKWCHIVTLRDRFFYLLFTPMIDSFSFMPFISKGGFLIMQSFRLLTSAILWWHYCAV